MPNTQLYESFKEEFVTYYNENYDIKDAKHCTAHIISKRRLEQITSLDMLISATEKQIRVSQTDIKFFEDIAKEVDSDHLGQLVLEYNKKLRKNRNPTKTDLTNEKDSMEDIFTDAKQKKIKNVLSKKIGQHWKDFARKLDIMEKDITDIDLEYKNDHKRCCMKILHIFIEETYYSRWEISIIKALKDIKRDDLLQEVLFIFHS